MPGTEKKITLLSFSEQAAASCLRYVLLLSSAEKHAGKQPSLAYQMCLVRISCGLKPWHSTQHRQVLLLQLFEFSWLFWREATGMSLTLKLVVCECLAEPRPKFPYKKKGRACISMKINNNKKNLYSHFHKAWK